MHDAHISVSEMIQTKKFLAVWTHHYGDGDDHAKDLRVMISGTQ